MKSVALIALALACVLGLAAAQLGYGYGTQASTGGFGNGGFLALIGLLFLLVILFGGNFGGTNTFIYGNFSGPTGGK